MLKSLFTLGQDESHRPLDSSPQALGPAPWELLTRPNDPRERLSEYLAAWASMDEATWPGANIKALLDDIMDIFHEHPEAEGWYREWKAANPEARW